ncbi:MAG TPA: c-type cytochrome [Thermoanaerobaculaceae bacterium]|nr:c-type cytochrome [Thermoanaerobaculaceae bacterium]
MTGRAILACLPVVACLALVACGLSEEEQGRQDEVRREGVQLFAAESCGACHGAERQGSATGPALSGLGRHWTEDTLVAFLRAPATAVVSDSRLEKLARRYPAQMAGLPGASEEKLRALARYLLLD